MFHGIKTSLLVFLLLLIYLSPGVVESYRYGSNPIYPLHKDGIRIKSRKLLVTDVVLDYDYAGANPRHDPRKGKPGGGSKIP